MRLFKFVNSEQSRFLTKILIFKANFWTSEVAKIQVIYKESLIFQVYSTFVSPNWKPFCIHTKNQREWNGNWHVQNGMQMTISRWRGKKVEECWEFENNPGVLKRCAFLNRETERGAKLSIPNWFEANFTWEKNTKNS